MWFIIDGETQMRMSNANDDVIKDALVGHYPTATLYRHASDADHAAALAHLDAGTVEDGVFHSANNTGSVNLAVNPPVFELRDADDTVVASQPLELVS
jgi:hypothetical protein